MLDTIQLEALRAGAISKFLPGVRDNITTSSTLMQRLYYGRGEKARGPEKFRSGPQLVKLLQYRTKPSARTNGRDSIVNPTHFQGEIEMKIKYSWRTADVLLFDEDLDANNTGEKLYDLVGRRIKNASDGLKDDIALDSITGSQLTDPNAMDGIQRVVAADNIYGGINRLNDTWFQSKVIDHTGSPAITIGKLDIMHDDLTKGLQTQPTIQVTSTILWRSIADQVIERYKGYIVKDPTLAKWGVEHVVLNGSGIIKDINIPVGEYYHLNEDALWLFISPKYNIVLGDWESVPGQPHAKCMYIKFAGALWCEESRLQGKHTGFVPA